MENTIEQNHKPHSVLDEDDFREMAETRMIDPEDFGIIEKLSSFPKSLFIEYHNYFSFSRENTLRDMERDLGNLQNELARISQYNNMEDISLLKDRIAFLSAFIEFARKYDWTACNNLNRVFERREIRK